jgi:hypothetical protein
LYRFESNTPASQSDPSGEVPTSETLKWKDFTVVEGPRQADARTVWNHKTPYEGITVGGTESQRCGIFTVVVKATLIPGKFGVEFNARRSWVVKGKETAYLLEHERLHLRMAEYIAIRAQANLGEISASIRGIGPNREDAIAEARKAAVRDVLSQFQDYIDKWSAIDQKVQEKYDEDTNHSQNMDAQKDWQENWKEKVDGILKENGWPK